MKKSKLLILFVIILIITDFTKSDAHRISTQYNICDFGAVGDGKTLCTEAINQAIEACSKAGGGTVFVPEGTFLTGTIFLKSNITLNLKKGAVILGTHDLDKYTPYVPTAETKGPEHFNWNKALLLGVNVENVTITGKGTINGDHVSDPNGEERMRGPHTVLFGESKNISLSNITINNAGNYAFLAYHVENATFKNLTFNAGWDGIHIRWCKNLTITKCEFYTGDDAIAGGYWENAIITGNTINSSCNGIRLIMPASQMRVENCNFYGPCKYEHRTSKEKMRRNMLSAIILQPGGWGKAEGALEDILLKNITIDNVNNPVMIILNENNNGKNIVVEKVKATHINVSACSVESWTGGVFDDVTFRNIQIDYIGNADPEMAKIELSKPHVDARPLPCWAWFACNVNKLTLENINLSYKGEEIRPAFIFEKIKQLNLKNVRYQEVKNVKPAILKNVDDIKTENVTPEFN